MHELYNDTRYKLYAKRGALQARLEMIDIAIQQHNRYFEDDANLLEARVRVDDAEAFDRHYREIDGI